MKEILFAATALLTVGFAFYAALSRNVVYSAFGLLASLTGVAGLYIFLSGDFLAAVQVLVYVGGVMVLFLFALMVTSGIAIPAASNPGRRAMLALVAVVPFVLVSVFFVSSFAGQAGGAANGGPSSSGSVSAVAPGVAATGGGVYSPITAAVGRSLIERHMVSFEVLSVLLLVALVGAVAIVRKTIASPEEIATGPGPADSPGPPASFPDSTPSSTHPGGRP